MLSRRLLGRRHSTSSLSTATQHSVTRFRRCYLYSTTPALYHNGDRRHDDRRDKRVSIVDDDDDRESLIGQIPIEDVRNFCFIAHIDHGKSSISSRILELTGNLGREAQNAAWEAASTAAARPVINLEEGDGSVSSSEKETKSNVVEPAVQQPNTPNKSKERIELLDTLSVEQERGITVKASTATMLYQHPSAVGPTGTLLLNMYDTPGHVDFFSEVARSLCFVQGAILLLDATQGIQAQTLSVYETAKSLPNPPKLLVALTKIDLHAARPVHVALTASEWLSDCEDPDTIIHTSARNRIGVKELLGKCYVDAWLRSKELTFP